MKIDVQIHAGSYQNAHSCGGDRSNIDCCRYSERNIRRLSFQQHRTLRPVGNVLALPVISILVMPFAVLSLVLMPLQLDWLPLQIMGFGVLLVRHIASLVASFSPDGNPGVMPASTLILWTVALVIAVVSTTRLRWLALPFVIAGLVVLYERHCRIFSLARMQNLRPCACPMAISQPIAAGRQNSQVKTGRLPI